MSAPAPSQLPTLLLGPPEAGGLAVARRMVSALFCPARAERPCLRCPTCLQISRGEHPEVLEVAPPPGRVGRAQIPIAAVSASHDAAHTYPEHLIEFVSVAPRPGQQRCVILCGADLLSAAAANALLKTLEQPPHRARFFLIASDLFQVLPTVRSRCQVLLLPPLPPGEAAALLLQAGASPDSRLLAYAAGWPGPLLEHTRSLAVLQEAEEFLAGLDGDLLGALEAAEAFEKRLDLTAHPRALAVLTAAWPVEQRLGAELTMEQAWTALDRRCNPGPVLTWLAMALRRVRRAQPVAPLYQEPSSSVRS